MSKRKRLDREDWLEKALEILAEMGSAEIRIDALAINLGVTKGSFYWHFKDREEFMHSLLDYWMQAFTINVVEKIDATPGSPEKRLLSLMQFLSDTRSGRYDVAVRAWASREPKLDSVVKKVDKQRLSYIGSLFTEMGFQGAELEMRTQIFVVYHSLEESFLSHMKLTNEERAELLKLRHAFFTRP